MRLIIVSHDLSENALGRAHVIWTLARAAGYETLVRGTSRGPVWEPLRSSAMAADIQVSRNLAELRHELHVLSSSGSLLVPVKTWPSSLGVCVDVARMTGGRVLADIDDPDHAALVGRDAPRWYRSTFRLRMRLRRESPSRFDRLQTEVRSMPKMVSNPVLLNAYGGGHLVPHARHCGEKPVDFGSPRALRVAFVGTPRAHKGLNVLRSAIAELAGQGAELTITAGAPKDAQPWESWVGITDFPTGRKIVASSDVIVIPQAVRGYAAAQLPAKLIDAMVLGRPIVATSTEPIRWALGGTGLLIAPSDSASLNSSLRSLFDIKLRRKLGIQAWERAQQYFSIDAVCPAFIEAASATTEA